MTKNSKFSYLQTPVWAWGVQGEIRPGDDDGNSGAGDGGDGEPGSRGLRLRLLRHPTPPEHATGAVTTLLNSYKIWTSFCFLIY